MKKAIFVKPGKIVLQEADKPTIQAPDDVIIKTVRASVCGSDLWSYRGITPKEENSDNTGHEAIGVVEAIGEDITTVKPGDFVIAPFVHGCGQCAACRAGFEGGCLAHKDNYSGANQAEYIRYQHGQWALIKIPGKPTDYTDKMLASLQALSDVMPTGYHAARVAQVEKGDTVAVVGDGAVGLCAVISAKLRGAKRIIIMSRHADRQALAKEFGATDVVEQRGDEGVKKVLELTHGQGADAVLECVGTKLSVETALQIGRAGAIVGRVGVPHDAMFDLGKLFSRNVIIAGGPASVTTYDKQLLLQAVLDGVINPGKIFTKTYPLTEIQAAYESMDKREVIKSLLKMN
ncbi:zinc-dependent alcohol dehydrogenase family protein [Ligilactobacillus sp. WILCCON 0076]|uniref:Zinc-dependent alcohol dehydrogenase family protein n=1 Tax=Ligilactobacillus ubinensis TaxID=2876789 RepID=A0A9X2FGR4_9LACO|nr:zinc-dependent alcohol dehydrogenase family protein [Ligilactobacillus ubinensis]MCP0886039.1 zinc-dependent alcohol dehydrogenase family protein [Ligilactobacillus ubinensis]